MELPSALLSPSSKKKKFTSKKVSYISEMGSSSSKIKKFFIFQEMELSGPNIKKFLIFSQKKAFPIFRKMELFYVLGNGNPEEIPYISGNGTFIYCKQLFILQKLVF